MDSYRKPIRITGAVFAVYALLCATHLGEFWPFSIYPMFSSSAGKPWTRAIVREVPSDMPASELWREAELEGLPGDAFALDAHDVAQNDIANYVSKTRTWDEEHVSGLRAVFDGLSSTETHLLIMKVQGRLDEYGQVRISAIPLMLITPDSARLNPVRP